MYMYIDKNSIDSFIMALYMHFYLFYLFVIWILMCMQISAREIRNTENLTLKMSIYCRWQVTNDLNI